MEQPQVIPNQPNPNGGAPQNAIIVPSNHPRESALMAAIKAAFQAEWELEAALWSGDAQRDGTYKAALEVAIAECDRAIQF